MVTHSRAPLRLDRLRALNTPQSVEVELDDCNQPVAIVVEDNCRQNGRTAGRQHTAIPSYRRTARRAIESIIETWRIDDEWWRHRISRQYVEVVLEGGAHLVLYEDTVSGGWFLQRP